MAIAVTTFAEALADTDSMARDVLLGNGFSIAAHPPFAYGGLLTAAEISADTRAIFAAARSANFEAVMRYWLAEAFDASPSARAEARRNVEVLKHALIKAVHLVHPARRTAIAPARWAHCEQFLANFIGRAREKRRLGGRVFTTNYDLLLWWAVTPDRGRRKPDKLFKGHDGFRQRQFEGFGSADLIYLHGALHLFASGQAITKIEYSDAEGALHDQIARRLQAEAYPVFVSEGASALKRPPGPGYLRDALTKFKYTARSPERALFTLGHGLGTEDDHILHEVKSGKIGRVYLGAHGPTEIELFKPIAQSWMDARPATNNPVSIAIYDTTGVVWGQ